VTRPRLDRLPSWFVVLPDCEAAGPIADALSAQAATVVRHRSGRPLLIGRLSEAEHAVGAGGTTTITVVGEHLLSDQGLSSVAEGIGTPADLDRPARSWPGNFHLIASVAGRLRVQAPVSGFRRIVHATVDGLTIASDRADVLAALTGAALDVPRLTVMLFEPGAPQPIVNDPVWRGLSTVPPGYFLRVDRDGRHRLIRWWTAPEPTVPMAVGAAAVRSALAAAVDVRTRGRELVTTDLGGFDTTSLCCLAARGPAKVAAYTWESLDPAADDVVWGRRTVSALGNVEHHVIPSERTPFAFSGVGESDDSPLDEPCAITLDRRWLVIADLAAARGSLLHLSGFGGDQVLGGSVAHLHARLRRRPWSTLRDLRGYVALNRWPYLEVLRQLADNRSYQDWLLRMADEVTAAPSPSLGPNLSWGKAVRLPPWVAPAAADAVRDLIRRAAPSAETLGHVRGQHQEVADLGTVARVTRNFAVLARQRGVALAVPFLDDRVIEAGLAIRPEERVTPWRYKALAVEAMRGIIPERSLARNTKAIGSHEVEAGFRDNRADVLALCEDSRLGRLGVVDAAALREVCRRPLPTRLEFSALYPTLACEIWLRALERDNAPGAGVRRVS
jgi:asparagine synthase (glutamine-hydrolysing)